MTTEALNVYFAARLAFVDRPAVRLRTESEGDTVKVLLEERLEALVFPDPTRQRELAAFGPAEIPLPVPSFDTIGPSPRLAMRALAEVDTHAARSTLACDGIAARLRRDYDEHWRRELT